jgi:hypothetical protein
MQKRTPFFRSMLGVISLGSMGAWSSCDQDLLGDPGFDMWCGDTLCAWDIEEGKVEKVATWHEKDQGASLVGSAVAISQLSEADSDGLDCIRFELVAEVQDGAHLTLEMDFMDDGVVEYSHPLVTNDWENVAYTVTPPETFAGVRFRIKKSGDARAVIAQVRALSVPADECGDDAIAITGLTAGLPCTSADQCASGMCTDAPFVSSFGDPSSEATCGACETSTDCSGGQVCGVGWEDGGYHPYRACVDAGADPLGAACATGDQCESGICTDDQCAECGSADDCDGETCAPHDAGDGDASVEVMPSTCAPGDASRASDEMCLADADCASAVCESTELVRICDPDGRPCDTDADCPYAELGGACVTIGPADGTCR